MGVTAAAADPGRGRSCALCRLVPAVLLLLIGGASGFPYYDDPILATPPLVRPGAKLCTVDLITNAACDGYEKVIYQPFADPADNPACRGWVSKVVLDFYGQVKGVQFDR